MGKRSSHTMRFISRSSLTDAAVCRSPIGPYVENIGPTHGVARDTSWYGRSAHVADHASRRPHTRKVTRSCVSLSGHGRRILSDGTCVVRAKSYHEMSYVFFEAKVFTYDTACVQNNKKGCHSSEPRPWRVLGQRIWSQRMGRRARREVDFVV